MITLVGWLLSRIECLQKQALPCHKEEVLVTDFFLWFGRRILHDLPTFRLDPLMLKPLFWSEPFLRIPYQTCLNFEITRGRHASSCDRNTCKLWRARHHPHETESGTCTRRDHSGAPCTASSCRCSRSRGSPRAASRRLGCRVTK